MARAASKSASKSKDKARVSCSSGVCGGKGVVTFKEGVWRINPVAVQVLGICSALAVTNRLENSLVMGAALVFVTVGSNLFVSLLRNVTPRRIRMIAEVAIIATFVIVFDQVLKAYYWEMSKQLGPYVGLIITNCIVMGRAEAFALSNRPVVAMVDGLANGLGYAIVLGVIGFARELLGTGGLLGHKLLSETWYTPNQLAVLAPGAFIALGVLIAIYNWVSGANTKEGSTP
jgi:Na+-transporting NADH:ubiquinone oxidoreductase subunit D